MISRDQFRPFRRLPRKAWIGGVCAGAAYSLGVPTWLVRLIVTAMAVFGAGSLIVVYLLLWVFLPSEPVTPPDYFQRTGDGGV